MFFLSLFGLKYFIASSLYCDSQFLWRICDKKGTKNLLNDLVSSGIWNLTTFKLKFEPNLQTFSSLHLNLFQLGKIEKLRTAQCGATCIEGIWRWLSSGIINFNASRKPKIVGVGRGWLFLLAVERICINYQLSVYSNHFWRMFHLRLPLIRILLLHTALIDKASPASLHPAQTWDLW